MPELPEVESVRCSLLPVVCGRVISQAEILTPEIWLGCGLPVCGWQIAAIDRRGKYLLVRLVRPDGQTAAPAGWPAEASRAVLVIHLRMTGQLLLQTTDLPAVKHDHVRLRLDLLPTAADDDAAASPVWLVYHDTRRFGRFWLLPDDHPGQSVGWPDGLVRLGPEPLDRSFDSRMLERQLSRHPRTTLKAALLDQTVVAGLGNIYADEVLFASGLHPARPAGSLDQSEIARLSAAIVDVLRRSIDCQGTTLRDYVNGWNQKGSFQDCLMVYSRAGQVCRHCGTPIQHRRLAGRSTCWCPVCQPEKAPAVED